MVGISPVLLFPATSCLWMFVCRADDYWEGFKLFCYGYYSHSLQHEHEFRECKLGSSMGAGLAFLGVLHIPVFRRALLVCEH